MGRPFCKNFLILVKCPRDSRKKSDWFRCKKISQKLKYLKFKCEQSERYFFVLFYSFHHSAHVPCAKFRWRQAKSVSRNQALNEPNTETRGPIQFSLLPGYIFHRSFYSSIKLLFSYKSQP